MDKFMDMAKQGVSAYQKSQEHVNEGGQQQSSGGYGGGQPQGGYDSDVRKTGGAEYNRRDSTPEPDIDDDDAVQRASAHAGDSGDSSLFSQALSFAKGSKTEHKQPVDEAGVINAHKAAYQDGNASSLDAGSLGSAAAMQMLKQFTSGGGSASSGGGSQSQLVALAMGEASKLFDQSGGAASGNKQDAVNGAAMTVVKLLVQSKFGGGATGGENSGGIGALGSLLGGGGGGSGQLLGMVRS
ncbi:hypothetical protein EXIGLDRAFT_398871 [Exidia glandulosa HHB12029]|uniref:DUF7721 domain-containing protein n=1 Tax=Exidia glandulosa HHB12029 TaxID=1314781 RepID=A0A165BM12_EXIGL|nr:hypothetical protein EXIGLDRAFT_398871 [Exidia glandulosa HHB12029]